VIASLQLALPAAAQQPAAPSAAPQAEEPPIQTKVSAEAIQQAYRKILARWSSGDTERAPLDLIALEAQVLDEGQPKTRKALLKAEQAVIHQIGGVDLETLVPIAVLHHEAYRRLLEQGAATNKGLGLAHSRTMARDLAILYYQQSGLEGAGLVASKLLTSLGGMLLKAAQQLPAAELFEQAVELDGRNTAALMGLATIWEKNSQYDDAIKQLRKLLETEPGSDEARLRLALCLARREHADVDEARKTLQELLGNGTTPWVMPLAYEELARLESEHGKPAEVEKVLRRGLEHFPAEPRLRLQLAVALDRRGASKEAAELVDKVAVAAPADEASPRFLYNSVRPEAFAGAREFLVENSRSRLQVLAQALAGAGVAGDGVAR
jgi:tetratricopeptide (TPR) repeat protein